jgi:phage baseplate assembly protein W
MAIVSKTFIDFGLSLQRNPFSNDLQIIKNEVAIKQALFTLIKTSIYERPFNPLIGSRLHKLLFESFDSGVGSDIEDEIKILVSNYEPRVVINSIDTSEDIDNNSLNITINYSIIGQPLNPQSLNVLLERSF